MVRRLAVLLASLASVALVVLAAVVVWDLEANSRNEKFSLDETNFTIKEEAIPPGVPFAVDTYVLCSNGTAWHSSRTTGSTPRFDNKSLKLSPSVVLDALHSLENDSFLTLKDRYRDLSSFNNNWIDRLTIESNGSNKSVTMDWYCGDGLMPRSVVKLGELYEEIDRGRPYPYAISLNVSASMSDNPSVVTISGAITNNENYSLKGMCPVSIESTGDVASPWSVVIVRSDGLTVAEFPHTINPGADGWFQFDPHTTNALNNFSWNVAGLESGLYVVWGGTVGNPSASGYTMYQLSASNVSSPGS